jgi:hypothetical protein
MGTSPALHAVQKLRGDAVGFIGQPHSILCCYGTPKCSRHIAQKFACGVLAGRSLAVHVRAARSNPGPAPPAQLEGLSEREVHVRHIGSAARTG